MLAGMVSANFVACNNELENVTPPEQEEYITVQLGVIGEFLDFKDSPLTTRAGGVETYGFEVLTSTEEPNIYTEYAYGGFTTLEDASIKLLVGQTYQFTTTIIVDDEIIKDNNDNDMSSTLEIPVDNEFKYGYKTGKGLSEVPSDYEKERFYGQLEYTAQKDGTINISTKRVMYGTHYIAEGLTEGSIRIDVGDGANFEQYSVNLTVDTPEHEGIYSFRNPYAAWLEETYSESVVLSIYWIKEDGSETLLAESATSFTRNVKTTITIKLPTESEIEKGVTVTKDETTMTDDEYEYVIEDGQLSIVQ